MPYSSMRASSACESRLGGEEAAVGDWWHSMLAYSVECPLARPNADRQLDPAHRGAIPQGKAATPEAQLKLYHNIRGADMDDGQSFTTTTRIHPYLLSPPYTANAPGSKGARRDSLLRICLFPSEPKTYGFASHQLFFYKMVFAISTK